MFDPLGFLGYCLFMAVAVLVGLLLTSALIGIVWGGSWGMWRLVGWGWRLVERVWGRWQRP
jgi:hypothetical protein